MFSFEGNLNYADCEHKTLILNEKRYQKYVRSASKNCPSGIPHEND